MGFSGFIAVLMCAGATALMLSVALDAIKKAK